MVVRSNKMGNTISNNSNYTTTSVTTTDNNNGERSSQDVGVGGACISIEFCIVSVSIIKLVPRCDPSVPSCPRVAR